MEKWSQPHPCESQKYWKLGCAWRSLPHAKQSKKAPTKPEIRKEIPYEVINPPQRPCGLFISWYEISQAQGPFLFCQMEVKDLILETCLSQQFLFFFPNGSQANIFLTFALTHITTYSEPSFWSMHVDPIHYFFNNWKNSTFCVSVLWVLCVRCLSLTFLY